MTCNFFGANRCTLAMLLGVCLLFGINSCQTLNVSSQTNTLQLAFGSCSNQERDFDLFAEVLAAQPDYFIWLGDMVYPKQYNIESLTEAYEKQYHLPNYKQLRQSSVPILGIYDDHDYGENDGGKNNPIKHEARDLMLNFLDIKPDSYTYNKIKSQEGAYQSYFLKDWSLGLYILDTRWSRSDLLLSSIEGQRYQKSMSGQVLSDEQWRDFENFVESYPVKTLVVISSIQLLNDSHHFEKWGNFPSERDRMISLLENFAQDGKKVIVLSGDRHFSEISEKGNITEITSSGMTEVYTLANEPNPLRISPMIKEPNFSVLRISKGKRASKMSVEYIGLNSKSIAEINLD